MYKQKTQIYVRVENFGLGYFNSINITDTEQWRDRLPEYLVEREKYDRWVAMYGTDTFINVVFHNDYCSGRDLVGMAYHLMEMTTKLKRGEISINPFLSKNWEYGSRNLPGVCVYNQPETGIAFLHAYVSGAFSSKLAEYCNGAMPVFELMNRSIYDDSVFNESEHPAGLITRFDELDNNDGILLVDMISKKYCFIMTDTFDPSNAKEEITKFTPINASEYIQAFYPETVRHQDAITVNHNIKLNKPFKKVMKGFDVLSLEDVREWFPEMQERIPVEVRFRPKGYKTPPVFEDAQRMAELYPQTFEAPTEEMLSRITVGSSVKVCAKVPKHIQTQRAEAGLLGIISERFWVMVTATDGKILHGTVDNTTQHVELNAGDKISFEHKNVYQIY
jgi:hypothetical protein